jgi:hypothetical protein
VVVWCLAVLSVCACSPSLCSWLVSISLLVFGGGWGALLSFSLRVWAHFTPNREGQ